MQLKTILQIVVGAVSYSAWGVFAFFDPSVRPDFLHFNVGIAMGVIGLVLRDMQPAGAAGAPPKDRETGAASTWCMAVLASTVLVVMAGCASVQQAVQAYGSVAVTSARAANDTLIEAQKVSFCGLPLSAIARHPEIVPAIRSLCLASGDKTSAEVLDAIGTQK